MLCSNSVHKDAAQEAFATREYKKGKVIEEYTGALYVAREGTQLWQFHSQKLEYAI